MLLPATGDRFGVLCANQGLQLGSQGMKDVVQALATHLFGMLVAMGLGLRGCSMSSNNCLDEAISDFLLQRLFQQDSQDVQQTLSH